MGWFPPTLVLKDWHLELAREQSAEHDCRKLPAVVADAAGGWQRREEQGRLLLCRQGLVTLLKG
jgi:hypothetical protein